MSGDLLLAFCRAPHTPDGQVAPEHPARPVLAARIDALPQEVIEEVAMCTFGDMAESDRCAECGGVVTESGGDRNDDDHMIDGFDEDVPCVHAVRKTLHSAVDSLFTQNRVCYSVYLDAFWIVSGGISGGDSPTDEYDDLHALAVSGVTIQAIPTAAETSG